MTETDKSPDRRLCKHERICLKNDIKRLFNKGRYISASGLRCCYLNNNGLDFNRIMFSVPKRNFKRAVKRNLLKRRLREAYRNNKQLLPALTGGTDMLIIYTDNNVRTSEDIAAGIRELLARLSELAIRMENGSKKGTGVSTDTVG